MSYLLINRTEFQMYIHWSDRILLTGLCLRDLVYSPLTTKYQRLFQLPVVAMAFLLLLSISSPTSYSSKPLRLSSLSIRIYSTNVTCKAWNSFNIFFKEMSTEPSSRLLMADRNFNNNFNLQTTMSFCELDIILH